MRVMRQKDYNNKLYIIPTPIGNLEDITIRALNTLKKLDILYCEDTRVSAKLLQAYDINLQTKVFNDHSNDYDITKIIEQLQSGMNVGLVSDAGMPGISDPGYKLINACYNENICVEVLPGACAFLTALVSSNLAGAEFQFLGFIKRNNSDFEEQIINIKNYNGISILYDSPRRVLENMKRIAESDNFKFCLIRELTKIYEEAIWGSYEDINNYYNDHDLKGEVVLLVKKCESHNYDNISDAEIVTMVEDEIKLGELKNHAIKKVAKKLNRPRKEVYNLFIKEEHD